MTGLEHDSDHLVADIGGTHARLALCRLDGRMAPELNELEEFLCRDFDGLSEVVAAYLERHPEKPRYFSISIAAPTDSDEIRMTNLAWQFSLEALTRAHGFSQTWAINDAAAGVLATTELGADRLETLHRGAAVPGQARINLIPGTGFGVGAAFPHNGRWLPIQGEGGHANVAAHSEAEQELLGEIARQHGRAIGDTVLSGPGMLNIYQALARIRGQQAEPFDAPEMTRRALERGDPLCESSLELYCGLFGQMAGDLTLTLNALGGVYLSGSLVQKIGRDRLSPSFCRGFLDKGEMRDRLANVPVYLVHFDHPGLLGAAVWLNDRLIHLGRP